MFGWGVGQKRGRNGFGIGPNWLLDDELEIVVDLSLIVEGIFEKGIVALLVHVGKIRAGTGDSGGVVLVGQKLGFGDKGLKN